jgi:hypothetical protein
LGVIGCDALPALIREKMEELRGNGKMTFDDDDLIVTNRKVDELLVGHIGWEVLRRIDEWWPDVAGAMMGGMVDQAVRDARGHGLVWTMVGGTGGRLLIEEGDVTLVRGY